jgi:hypothetical protein
MMMTFLQYMTDAAKSSVVETYNHRKYLGETKSERKSAATGFSTCDGPKRPKGVEIYSNPYAYQDDHFEDLEPVFEQLSVVGFSPPPSVKFIATET